MSCGKDGQHRVKRLQCPLNAQPTEKITLEVKRGRKERGMSTAYAEADTRMSAIEGKLTALEASRGNNTNQMSTAASNEVLFDYQFQLLDKLRNIRDALAADGGDLGQIREERDNLQAENLKLKKEAEKLNYRVRHLVKALTAAEEGK